MSVTPIKLAAPSARSVSDLWDAVRKWWDDEQSAWPDDAPTCPEGEEDLWNNMPEIDSKAVARTSPLFTEHLGMKLDVRLIRHGGYANIDEMLSDLVPKMIDKIKQQISKKAVA